MGSSAISHTPQKKILFMIWNIEFLHVQDSQPKIKSTGSFSQDLRPAAEFARSCLSSGPFRCRHSILAGFWGEVQAAGALGQFQGQNLLSNEVQEALPQKDREGSLRSSVKHFIKTGLVFCLFHFYWKVGVHVV